MMEGGSACCASRMEHEEHRTPCRGIQPPCMGQVCFVQTGWHFRLFCHSTLSWDAYDSTGCVLPACRCPGWAGSALAGAGCMCGRGAASVRKKELEQERDKHDLHAFQAFRRGLCGYVSFRLRPKGMAGERIAAALSFFTGAVVDIPGPHWLYLPCLSDELRADGICRRVCPPAHAADLENTGALSHRRGSLVCRQLLRRASHHR